MADHRQEFDIYVISLRESAARHENITAQFSKLPLRYELKLFERAADIHIAEYDRKRRLGYYGYDMVPGEVGCFTSHRHIWQMIQQNNRAALVLEDDFLVTHSNLSEVLSALNTLAERFPITRLQTCAENKTRPIKELLDMQVVTYSKTRQGGTTAYFIYPAAAKRLYENSNAFFMPVDDYMDTECLHDAPVYGLYPPPITIINAESEIGVRNKPGNLSPFAKMRRELYRLPIVYRQFLFTMRKKA